MIPLLCTDPIQHDLVEPFHCPLYELCYLIPKTVEVCSLFSSTHAQKGRVSMGWELFFYLENFLLSSHFLK